MLTVSISEFAVEEFDDDFDLDIRIDDTDPAEPDRIHRIVTFGTSCTMCCAGGTGNRVQRDGLLHRPAMRRSYPGHLQLQL